MFTEEQAAAYLAGLIDGEGHVSARNKYIYIGATDVEMIKAAVGCCEVLGLHCTEYQPRDLRGNRQQIYEVRIRTQESLQRVADVVPLQIGRKNEALRVALSRFKRSPKPSRDWLYQKYMVEGLTGPEIAKLTDTTATRVYNWLRRSGIPIKTSRGWASVEKKRPAKEWLVERYVAQQQSPRKLADELDVSRTTVFRWLDRYGIPRRRPHVTGH